MPRASPTSRATTSTTTRTWRAYFQAKRRLFTENLSAGGVAVVNGDDTYTTRIYNEMRQLKRQSWKFSRAGNGELSASNVEFTTKGIKATLKTPAGDIAIKVDARRRAQPREHLWRGGHRAGGRVLAA